MHGHGKGREGGETEEKPATGKFNFANGPPPDCINFALRWFCRCGTRSLYIRRPGAAAAAAATHIKVRNDRAAQKVGK